MDEGILDFQLNHEVENNFGQHQFSWSRSVLGSAIRKYFYSYYYSGMF